MATRSEPPANHHPFLVFLVFHPKRRHNTPQKYSRVTPESQKGLSPTTTTAVIPKTSDWCIMQNFGNPHTPFAKPPPPLPLPNAPGESQESYLEPSQMGGSDARLVRLFYEEPATAEEHWLAAAKLQYRLSHGLPSATLLPAHHANLPLPGHFAPPPGHQQVPCPPVPSGALPVPLPARIPLPKAPSSSSQPSSAQIQMQFD
ncbi:hypothetical protein PCANC_05722 [Puccinia coronata f. sp. avenae]|uniref:Uncharacterized protein n=1 Tax=Puccinia coronata f. sp. avenae TaxID=200324 RepID=A0A2N5TDH7_9BASI|nr:hypothetical protein PCASD_09098 [Puccinia coronata f. sp. avenae]PLW52903.1 hypothetical protein PCANC_05722 [Puccinia coronata f. sp. avenae]